MPLSTNTADDDILYERGDIYWGPDVPDVPDYVSDSYVRNTGIGPPSEPSHGDLVCATQSASGPSFIQGNALGNVMDFCAGGLSVSGPPITKTYVQPTGGDALYIEAIFVDNEGACFPGETVNWDEDRCKFILNRPIFECEPDSNPQTQITKYGGKIAADCVNITVTPQSVPESVFCGAFDDGGGMGFKAFTPDEANDAIDKYCNSDTYTADPSYDTTPYGVRIIGYAMDRFWYKDGVYCLTTSPHPPPPNIPADQSVCHSDGSMDFELDVGVKFKTDQALAPEYRAYSVLDPTRRAYLKNPENRESLSAVEYINGVGQDIPPMLIISGVNILAPWFFNDLADDLLMHPDLPEDLQRSIMRFAKGACASARKGELMEERFSMQIQAEKARKARKAAANRVLSTGGVLYAHEARSMTRDRLEKEELRAAERAAAWDKRYTTALSKVMRATKSHRQELEYRMKGRVRRWKVVLKELRKKTPYYVV
ncbi:hypothetical protein OEA41_004738 [Lepraria neglecta]|uniref:Uncharacterized protein n=1 Tax=Lepraria neglecta TaxID=209136 RepID=A0AAD9YZQ6_9LECA|nr:hypothetical protein OEA41_004738 [Lepraria neglecta]